MTKKSLDKLIRHARRFLRQDRNVQNDPEFPTLEIDESFVIAHMVQSIENPTLLQIGAFDGITNDLWYPWIRRMRINAILLEPQLEFFNKLVENHRESPQVRCLNVAVGERDENRNLFYIETKGKALPDWASQLASFSEETILSHKPSIPELESLVRSTPVRCMTYQTLFREQKLHKIDALQIDAEGYDKILIELFPFSQCLPKLVRFESRHLCKNDLFECKQLLASKGYSFFKFNVPRFEGDTIAYLS